MQAWIMPTDGPKTLLGRTVADAAVRRLVEGRRNGGAMSPRGTAGNRRPGIAPLPGLNSGGNLDFLV